MVLDRKETTVAYRCPECGSVVISRVGIFALSADMIKLKCPCGGSELIADYTNDKKVRLSVPCFVCPHPHTFTVSSNVFFGSELFRIPCAVSGLDICFSGKSDDVGKAAAAVEDELREMLGDSGIENLFNSRGEEYFNDPQVLEIITFVVRDLCDEGNLHCRCPDGECDPEVEIGDWSVTVKCKKCGAMAIVPADSLSRATDFLGADSLDLN